MRSSLFLLLAAPLVVACGDDDGGKITLPDAKVFMDAAIDAPLACSVESSLGQIATGTNQARRMGDWFDVVTSGPDAGKTYFYVIGVAASSTQGAIDGVLVEYVKPTSGFATGSALNFITDPTATTPGPVAYAFGDLNPQNNSFAHFFWASNGSLTVTNIGEADGSMINGSVSQTNFRQINDMTGADIPGGCTTMLPSMTFALTQMASAATGKSEEGLLPQETVDMMIRQAQLFRSQHIGTSSR
jgi:hypothetical protein